LRIEEKALQTVLTEQGPGAYEGELFRATVSQFERSTLDMDAVRAKLSPQFIRANTSISEVTTVRVVSRNAVELMEKLVHLNTAAAVREAKGLPPILSRKRSVRNGSV
jgi:hypothetical protein